MDHANSPSKNSPPPPSKTTLKHLKMLFIQALRRTKGFLEAQKLPYVANKACSVYIGTANKAYQAKCRRLLQTRVELNPAQLHRFFHTKTGEKLLAWFERFFHLPGDRLNQHGFKDLLLQMAANPEGLSILSFLDRFPHTLQLNLDQLLLATRRVELLLKETDAIILAIRELAIAEARAEQASATMAFAESRDLRQPGPYAVKQFSLLLEKTPSTGGRSDALSCLRVECYQPDPFPTESVPVVIQSHGLASNPAELAPYAKHLASYGYFVAAPQHPGSDAEQVRNMLAGRASEVFKLTEFVDRPLDIRYLLDELAQRNASEFKSQLNLEAVGVMGDSFGAYTAFALAGAEIQFDRLEIACGTAIVDPNISLLLQCEALDLPRQTYELKDDRVQAILSMDSVGSEVFGQLGIAKIQIPTFLIAGSHDAAAPLALEQVRIFQWLTSPHHALALVQGKAHIRDMKQLFNTLDLQIKLSPQPVSLHSNTQFEHDTKALCLAFFSQHLAPHAALSTLSASYAAYLSQPPGDLWLISQTSSAQLRQQLQTLDQTLLADEMTLSRRHDHATF
jgi:predicted dienelactone hydrolase